MSSSLHNASHLVLNSFPTRRSSDLYDYEEPAKKIVPHRVLAINRGEKLKVLTVKLQHDLERLKNYISKQVIKEDSQTRSEEHTSELQSRGHLVCRLLLEKIKL